MKAEERTISNILTEQICYEIPPYQRPYSWQRENIQQLLEDIWDAFENNDKEYFIGSLITIEKERDRCYDVVDGQQRLTTLNLIFARLRDNITDGAAKVELGKRILPQNVLTNEAESPRLLLRKKDQHFFRKHVLDAIPVLEIDRAKLEAPQLRIIENLDVVDHFCLNKTQQTLKLFANFLLSKVYIVFVTTDSLQSAYRLFNVLNARGMSLSNADLIKNTLFSKLASQSNKSDELEERWLELEEELGIENLDVFFSHHRTSLTAIKASQALHEEMKPLIDVTVGGPFAFLEVVQKSAENYTRILMNAFSDLRAQQAIKALHRVKYDEWIPALLAFLNKPVSDLPETDYIVLLEKITMQNWIRRLGRTARLTVYYQLITAIREQKGAQVIQEIFKNASQNEDFLNLLGGEIYGAPFDKAILLRLEESSQDDSVIKIFNGQITIEHVLPKALKEEYWTSRFEKEEHKIWLNRLGNLALLSGQKNSKAQYYDFERKKKIYNDRNKLVSFDLTKEICNKEAWTVAEIKNRQARLLDLAQQIWAIH